MTATASAATSRPGRSAKTTYGAASSSRSGAPVLYYRTEAGDVLVRAAR
ncbi:hypothetical protein [Nonomuraea solani]|nr:hypothetical protein [Nonomuraea solani]